jgi:hypothetical protein
MLNKITIRKGSNPATLFEQIASVVNRYNTVTKKIPEDELIAVVLDKSPNEYKAVLTAEKRVKAASVTLEDLESAMIQHWRQIGGSDEMEANNEISLAAMSGVLRPFHPPSSSERYDQPCHHGSMSSCLCC